MKASLPLKLGIGVVLLFAAVLAIYFLWKPEKTPEHSSDKVGTMDFNKWRDAFKNLKAKLEAKGIDEDEIRISIDPPASEDEIRGMESGLGFGLPPSMKEVFLKFSKAFLFAWDAPEEMHDDMPFGICWGSCEIELASLPELEKNRKGWIKECYPNIEDPYHKVYHNKLAIIHVPNGDLIAVDMEVDDGPVVYLSHEGDTDSHGMVLGKNFIDFLDKWIAVGCVGPEDWYMETFMPSKESGIDPTCKKAVKWKKWLELENK